MQSRRVSPPRSAHFDGTSPENVRATQYIQPHVKRNRLPSVVARLRCAAMNITVMYELYYRTDVSRQTMYTSQCCLSPHLYAWIYPNAVQAV